MNSMRFLAYLPLLIVVGCGNSSTSDQPTRQIVAGAADQVAFSPAERSLLDGGALQSDVLAARAFISPFTRTDQASCFGAPALAGVKLAAREGESGQAKIARVVIAIDGSGSMAGRIGSRTKLELARDATASFVSNLPEGVPVSLQVFGQQGDNSEAGKARSCRGIDTLAPMSSDRTKLMAALGGIRAVGWTPLAAGLRAAKQQLGASAVPGEQIIYVVSDGIETCGGDPVAVAREINEGGTRAIVNVIGFGLPAREAAALSSVASVGGGRFVNVRDDDSYNRAMTAFREEMRRAENRVSASNARATNAIATGADITDAAICTGGIIQRETSGALADYDARRDRGDKLPPRYAVVALLKERHDALAARRDAYSRQAGSTRDTANRAIETAREAAQ